MALRTEPRAIAIVTVALVLAVIGGALTSRALIHSGAAQTRTTTLARAQISLIILVNQTRARHHLHALNLDMRLESLAAIHTIHMIRGGYFSHDEPHADFTQRVASLKRREVRENLAWGTGSFGTARGTLALWLASPPHRANLLNPAMRRIGIAILRGGPYFGQNAAIITTADLST